MTNNGLWPKTTDNKRQDTIFYDIHKLMKTEEPTGEKEMTKNEEMTRPWKTARKDTTNDNTDKINKCDTENCDSIKRTKF